MEIGGYDHAWWVPTEVDIVMEVETVASLFWPNFVLEYDEDDDREPPKVKNFFIHRNKKTKARIEEEGVTESLQKSLLHFLVGGSPAPTWRLLTVVTDKPEGEIGKMIEMLKENMNAIDAELGEQLNAEEGDE